MFYLRKTGEIVSAIEGRVHPKDQLGIKVRHGGVPESEMGRFIVPSIREGKEILPTMPFREAILRVERQEALATDFRLITEKGKVVGIEEK